MVAQNVNLIAGTPSAWLHRFLKRERERDHTLLPATSLIALGYVVRSVNGFDYSYSTAVIKAVLLSDRANPLAPWGFGYRQGEGRVTGRVSGRVCTVNAWVQQLSELTAGTHARAGR